MKLRVTINIDEQVPEGTALLFILAEIIKDVPAIADLSEGCRVRYTEHLDQGQVSATVSRLKNID